MKKNIFSVIITALTVINVVLTAVLFFVMMPTFQKTNNLITQVASVLNLETDADSDADPDSNYSIKDVESVSVSFDSQTTYNLKNDEKGNPHYALMSGYIVDINKNAEDYKDVSALVNDETQQIKIGSEIGSVLQSLSIDEAGQPEAQQAALERLREVYDTKAIVKVVFASYTKQ